MRWKDGRWYKSAWLLPVQKTTCTKLPVQLGQYTYEEVRILSHKKMNRKDRALDCMSEILKKNEASVLWCRSALKMPKYPGILLLAKKDQIEFISKK